MRGRMSFGTAFSVGVLPRPGVGPTAAIGFQWRRFGMAVEGRALLTPSFSVGQDHAAWATLPLGILSLSLQMVRLPAPFYTLELCPFVGAGRLIVQTVHKHNQPNYFASEAHPFQLMIGARVPLVWQLSRRNQPEFYFKTFLEGSVGLLRNHISFNNVTVWGPFPQFGLTVGVELSIIANQPRKWDQPDPDRPVGIGARAERRY
jgi:hypothetical protein